MTEPVRNQNVPRNLKQYFLCLLKRGPRWDDTEGDTELLPRHLAYLRHRFEEGSYRIAGPVLDESGIAGVTMIEARTIDAAQKIADEDPSVASGRLVAELHPVLVPALDSVHAVYDAVTEKE
jgi:uncharacterized protein YciI